MIRNFTDNESIPASPDVDTPKGINEVANAITKQRFLLSIQKIQTNLLYFMKDERWIIDRVRLDDLAVYAGRAF
jgi:hypothetical protein